MSCLRLLSCYFNFLTACPPLNLLAGRDVIPACGERDQGIEPSTVGTRFTYVERFAPARTLKLRLFGRRARKAHVVKERLRRLKALAEDRTLEAVHHPAA